MRLLSAILLLATACSIGILGVPGITRDEAIAISVRGHPEAQQVRAEAGTFGELVDNMVLPGEPRDRLVWSVRFLGIGDCYGVITPDGGNSCPDDPFNAEYQVVLDYRTGEFLFSSSHGLP